MQGLLVFPLLSGLFLLLLVACEYPGVPHPMAANVESGGSSSTPTPQALATSNPTAATPTPSPLAMTTPSATQEPGEPTPTISPTLLPTPTPQEPETNDTPVPTPLAAVTPTPRATATPTPTPEPVPAVVQISLKDFRLDPDKVAAKAGDITFVLKNEGRYTHDFRVEGQGIDEKAPKVGQGRTFEWQITLPAGSYRISCPISNHADRGMNGTMEVAQ